MPARKSPALQKTVTYIRGYLQNAEVSSLPSVRTIAKACEVSMVTVVRAMELLKEEGLISSVWGRGYFSSSKRDSDNICNEKVDFVHTPKYQLVFEQFKADIFNGRFKLNSALPCINQLAAFYNVSRPTIGKVISKLISVKLLRRIGVKYYLYTGNSSRRQKVAIIAFGLSQNTPKIETERERNFFRNLSNAAMLQNVDLQIICCNDYPDSPHFFLPDGHTLYSYLKQNEICGIIFSAYHMNDSARCLRQIINIGKPVSICIEDHHVLQSMSQYSTNSKGLTFFDVSYSTIPGKDVGRYLMEKGHQEIAYISPFHKSTWSRNRLSGLQEIYSASNWPCKVHSFVLDDFINDYFYFMEKVQDEHSFQKDVACDQVIRRVPPFMRKRISSINYEYNIMLRDALIFNKCKPLIKQASLIPAITAWVCANDLIACMVMDYWNFKNIPYSSRPALIGFDNAFGTFERGISTYEFNTGGEAHSMISHVLYPDSSFYSGKKRIVRLNGSIIERASTYGMNTKN